MSLPRATVLIVDDQPQIRLMVQRMLNKDDRFGAVEVHDGAEALAVVEEQAPDVVILDLAMPGLHGVDAIPALRQVSPQTKIVVFSGHTQLEADALARGADAFLPKTVDADGLIACLEEVLGLE